MSIDEKAMRQSIRQRVIDICAQIGHDASELGQEEIIPASGFMDSAGLLELIAWYDDEYQLKLQQEEITIDNLGSIAGMARFVIRRKQRSG